jgi:hypothetical protein
VAKKSKKKGNSEKSESKEPRALVSDTPDSTPPEAGERVARNGKEKPIIRAIRVTQEILDAAKAYKKAKGVSFYALGLEAISDRLVKEGFLTKADR